MDSGSGSTVTDQALDNDGTINGASWSSYSKIGEACMSFDGTDDYVVSSDFVQTGYVSVSCWVRVSNFAHANRLISNWSGSNTQGYQILMTEGSGSEQKFSTDIGTGDQSFWNRDVDNFSEDTWYHLVLTYDGKTLRLYRDGVLRNENKNASGEIAYSNPDLHLGQRGDGNHSAARIDDVRIYDRPLSTPEIKALYNLERPSKVSSGDTLR